MTKHSNGSSDRDEKDSSSSCPLVVLPKKKSRRETGLLVCEKWIQMSSSPS